MGASFTCAGDFLISGCFSGEAGAWIETRDSVGRVAMGLMMLWGSSGSGVISSVMSEYLFSG